MYQFALQESNTAVIVKGSIDVTLFWLTKRVSWNEKKFEWKKFLMYYYWMYSLLLIMYKTWIYIKDFSVIKKAGIFCETFQVFNSMLVWFFKIIFFALLRSSISMTIRRGSCPLDPLTTAPWMRSISCVDFLISS